MSRKTEREKKSYHFLRSSLGHHKGCLQPILFTVVALTFMGRRNTFQILAGPGKILKEPKGSEILLWPILNSQSATMINSHKPVKRN